MKRLYPMHSVVFNCEGLQIGVLHGTIVLISYLGQWEQQRMQIDVHAHARSPIGVHLTADCFKARNAARLLSLWYLQRDTLLLDCLLVWA